MKDQKWEEEFKKNYIKYRNKDDFIHNDRKRTIQQNFFDEIMSVDLKKDPDGKRSIEIIKAL
jgi:hypothetical protein